jgi:hypothetical protein
LLTHHVQQKQVETEAEAGVL